MIIYGRKQLEEIRENMLRLTATTSRRNRRIISPKIPNMTNGKLLSQVEKRQIYNCPSRKIQRISNCIFDSIRNLIGIKTDTFKRHLDKWLKIVPDQPKCGGYSERVAAESNSIQYQAASDHAHQVVTSRGIPADIDKQDQSSDNEST